MQNEWDIKGRSKICFVTGKEFQKGDFFYTLLYREPEGFRREDLCEEAWVSRRDSKDSGPGKMPFSFWKSRYEPPSLPPPEPLCQKDAESVLRRLIAENNSAHVCAIYILALLLERKRLLRPVEGQDEDTLVYEHPGTGEVFLIHNLHLSPDQIPNIQREVTELLAQNLQIEK